MKFVTFYAEMNVWIKYAVKIAVFQFSNYEAKFRNDEEKFKHQRHHAIPNYSFTYPRQSSEANVAMYVSFAPETNI